MKMLRMRHGPITVIIVGALAVILPALITTYVLKEVAINDSVNVGVKATSGIVLPKFFSQAFQLGMNMPEYTPVYFKIKDVTGAIGKHASIIGFVDTPPQARACPPARACPKAPLKAGFDPILLGYCFAAVMLLAWWQRCRAFERDMVMCVSTDGVDVMSLFPPINFGRHVPAANRAIDQDVELESTHLQVVSDSAEEELEDFDEGDPSWREPFRSSYLELYREMFADLAHNPALLQRLYEKSLRAHRRDADIIEKAYKETIFN
jgi:hypothetical protein